MFWPFGTWQFRFFFAGSPAGYAPLTFCPLMNKFPISHYVCTLLFSLTKLSLWSLGVIWLACLPFEYETTFHVASCDTLGVVRVCYRLPHVLLSLFLPILLGARNSVWLFSALTLFLLLHRSPRLSVFCYKSLESPALFAGAVFSEVLLTLVYIMLVFPLICVTLFFVMLPF